MIKQKKLLSHVKMGKEILMSGDIKIEKIKYILPLQRSYFSKGCTY